MTAVETQTLQSVSKKAIGKTALRPILSIHTINILGKKMAAFNPTPIYY